MIFQGNWYPMNIYLFGGFHLLHLYPQRGGDVKWDDYSIFETNVGFISMTTV